jgi:hypothetical protein
MGVMPVEQGCDRPDDEFPHNRILLANLRDCLKNGVHYRRGYINSRMKVLCLQSVFSPRPDVPGGRR